MENYSNFGLALGSIVAFSATVFIGCVCYWTKKEEILDEDSLPFVERNYCQLDDEMDAFIITMQEVNSEKQLLEYGLDKRCEQLDKWNMQQTSTPTFFKSSCIEQTIMKKERLQILHQKLKNGLHAYPLLNQAEATKLSYLSNSHQQYKEHHEIVREVAGEYFNAFEEYLAQLNASINESSPLFSV